MLRLSWTRTMVLACAKWMSAKSFKTRAYSTAVWRSVTLTWRQPSSGANIMKRLAVPIALVLIIETGRASRFHRDRHARFGNELLRGLVEANQRTIAVAWPRIDGQHVFHSGYERTVGLRRDDPVLAAMGLK